MPKLTVIIATYNRGFILNECISSLWLQSVPSSEFNVLVVDNNSADNTRKLVQTETAGHPTMRYVFESEQGLAHARNRGMAEAQTKWIAFLDDDAKAHPNWVETILDTIATDDFDVFGGPYYAWHHFGPPPPWLPDNFGTYLGPDEYGPLGEFHIPGGNCALKKNVAEAAGGFPTELGMAGNKSAYGEETLLFNRMRAQGCQLGFVPAMAIDHCVLPHKYMLRWQLVSAFASGRDASYAFEERFSWRELLRCCKQCIKGACKMSICCCNIWSPYGKMRAFVAARQIMNSVGRLYNILRMITKRKACPRP